MTSLVKYNGMLLHQVFVNARLHVSGGALGGGRMVEDSSSVAGISHLVSFYMTIHVKIFAAHV